MPPPLQSHMCLSFELLGPNLYELMRTPPSLLSMLFVFRLNHREREREKEREREGERERARARDRARERTSFFLRWQLHMMDLNGLTAHSKYPFFKRSTMPHIDLIPALRRELPYVCGLVIGNSGIRLTLEIGPLHRTARSEPLRAQGNTRLPYWFLCGRTAPTLTRM